MSIVLKLPLETAQLYLRNDPNSAYAQTAIAAHAMRISIEEAQAANLSRLSDEGMRAWLTCVKCIRDNAAANLARLMGEGKCQPE